MERRSEDPRANILAHHILALLRIAKNGARIWWAKISRASDEKFDTKNLETMPYELPHGH
jgi:hypothetical protein